jgi:hypothetical protein
LKRDTFDIDSESSPIATLHRTSESGRDHANPPPIHPLPQSLAANAFPGFLGAAACTLYIRATAPVGGIRIAAAAGSARPAAAAIGGSGSDGGGDGGGDYLRARARFVHYDEAGHIDALYADIIDPPPAVAAAEAAAEAAAGWVAGHRGERRFAAALERLGAVSGGGGGHGCLRRSEVSVSVGGVSGRRVKWDPPADLSVNQVVNGHTTRALPPGVGAGIG